MRTVARLRASFHVVAIGTTSLRPFSWAQLPFELLTNAEAPEYLIEARTTD
jgi:hypothetical protein